MTVTAKQIRRCLLDKVTERGPEKTICLSEVARALGGDDWRGLMAAVRMQGQALAATGQIVFTQKGQVVNPATAKGPIRYRLASNSACRPAT